jgi:trehalose 6-phosphate phosphatase
MSSQIGAIPHALRDQDQLIQQFAGRKPAVFLDYDGTLTPIVDRPEDAIISEACAMPSAVWPARCSVCVVSGRDRPVVQELMGVDSLIVAGSHGFDIWSPDGRAIQREDGRRVPRVARRGHGPAARGEWIPSPGALVEPKKASVAAHYRLVADAERTRSRTWSTPSSPTTPTNSR